jgi:hypothetical protein
VEMAVPGFYGPVGPHPFSRMKRAHMVVLYVYSLSTTVVCLQCFFIFSAQLYDLTISSKP